MTNYTFLIIPSIKFRLVAGSRAIIVSYFNRAFTICPEADKAEQIAELFQITSFFRGSFFSFNFEFALTAYQFIIAHSLFWQIPFFCDFALLMKIKLSDNSIRASSTQKRVH